MQCCSTDTGNVSVVFPVTLQIEASSGQARAGIAVTARGSYETPTFMPVGTRGAVKYLDAHDYRDIGAQIVLGNTYHLMLRPGADVVEHFGGLGKFSAWEGLTLTDSGGFQVFSLDPKIDDDGVTFKSLRRISAPFHPGDRSGGAATTRCRHPNGARCLSSASKPS